MYDPRLDDLPEAIPLRRVAPFWRVFAVLALLIAAGLGLIVFVMAVYVVRLREELDEANYDPSAAPTAPWPNVKSMPVPVNPDVEEPAVDPGNLPYPLTDDLRRPIVAKDKPLDPQGSARDRFLRKSQEVWKSPGTHNVGDVIVSPDGQQSAYFHGTNLVAGPLNDPQLVEETPRRGDAEPAVEKTPGREAQLVGTPAWSSDNRFVYFANAGGRMMRYDVPNQKLETLPYRGRSPVPLPSDPESIVFVRSILAAKADAPGSPTPIDPTEIVLVNLRNKVLRVVVPAGPMGWQSLTIAPDGKQLVAVSNCAFEKEETTGWRLHSVRLADGQLQLLKTPPNIFSPLGWAPDGKALIYARFQYPAPLDTWNDDGEFNGASDLYQWDLVKHQETRLSRGGGFFSPSVTADGTLCFLLRQNNPRALNGQYVPPRAHLRQMTLADARAFNAKEGTPPVRDLAAWTALLDSACREAKVSADANGEQLKPEMLAALATAFSRHYRERFKEEAPNSPTRFSRLARELAGLHWSGAERRRLILVLGAAEGEYLRHKHGATWHLVEGPLVKPIKPMTEPESPFGYVVNPFQRLGWNGDDDQDDEGSLWSSLDALLHVAEGRPLVLSNDAAAGQAEVAKQADADLERGTDLLKQGKGVEGEQVLLDMLRREAHANNLRLTLQVSKGLYDHGRKAALKRLMESRCAREPFDARQFNFLGLAQLEADPRLAMGAFKKALRCDLRYGPAYLNLAQALEATGDVPAAKLCLRRYLDMVPGGPLTDDAIRRLANLEQEER